MIDSSILISARGRLLTDQKGILDMIWLHQRTTGHGLPIKKVHHFLARGDARQYIEDFAEGLITETLKEGEKVYELTFLGALSCSYGIDNESLLERYIELTGEVFRENPEIKTISSEYIKNKLNLNDDLLIELSELLDFLGLWAGGNRGTVNYHSRIPDEIESIAFDDGAEAYLNNILEQKWRRSGPVSETERSYQSSKNLTNLLDETISNQSVEPQETSTMDFSFISNSDLKAQLESDWREIEVTRGVKAWKSSLIMCGSILEGVLVDIIARSKFERSVKEFLTKKGWRDIEKLSISQLVEVGSELGLIDKKRHNIMRIVNEFRNIIHPGKQLREGSVVDKEESDFVYSAITLCLRDIAKHKLLM